MAKSNSPNSKTRSELKLYSNHKIIDQKLVESEQKFQNLVDLAVVPVAITNFRGRLTYVNEALANLMGYSVDELIGRPFKEFIHPKDIGKIMRLFFNIIILPRQPRVVEFRVIRKDGNVLHLFSKPSKLVIKGKIVGFQAIIVNITDHRKTEKELQTSKEKNNHTSVFLNEILSNISDYVWVIDENYNIKFLNISAKKAYGDCIEKKCYQVIRNRSNPCHRSGIPCEIHEIIKKGKTHFEDIRPTTAIDRTTHIHAKPLTMPDGKRAIISVSRDVTEERTSKEKMEKSLSLLNTTLESTADSILVVNQNHKITNYNQKWVDTFDIPTSILSSSDDHQLMKFFLGKIKDQASFEKRTAELFSNPNKESLDVFKWEDGRIFERYSRSQRLAEKTIGRVMSFRDITEKKLAEEKLQNSQATLAEAQRIANLGNWEWNTFTNELSWSDEIYRIFGLAPQQFGASYDAFLNSVHPDDREFVKKSVKEALYENKPYSIDHRIILPDKSIRIVHEQAKVTFDETGKPIRMLGTVQDITNRNQMENKLRAYSDHLTELVEEKSRELIMSEQFLKTTIESIPDHIYIKDKDFRYVFVNDSYCKFKGKSKEEILNGNIYNLYPKEMADIFTNQDRQVFEKGSALHASEIPFFDASGSKRQIYTIKVPMKDTEGNVTHILGIARDMTQLKQAEEQLERIFNLSIDMICIEDLNGYFLKVNPAFEKVLGYTQKELLSKPFLDFVHQEDRSKTLEVLNRKLAKGLEVINFQNRYRCKNGSYKWLSWTAKPIPEEKIIIAVARDITEYKKLEKIKEHIISITTHELRTPLVSIIAYLNLAISGKLGVPTKDLENGLRIISRNADRLLNITNDLLDIKRIESGRLQLNHENIDFQEIVQNSAREIQPLIKEKGQTLHVEYPNSRLIINGDKIKLSQVLMNLLGNANKFTPEGGKVTLRVRKKKKTIQVEISDTGIGIKREDIKRIFTPFANIQKPSDIKGTGLGLSVTKGLVRAHGGTIKAESEGENKGATFTFTLLSAPK